MSVIIDGKKKAEQLRAVVARRVTDLIAAGQPRPGLAVVLVGEDPASQVYVRNKVKQSNEVGLHSVEHRLPADASQDQVRRLVEELNRDDGIHGILVQLPLPKHINEAAIINAISPQKDVDGLTIVNTGLLSLGRSGGLVPCTPLGCVMLLKDTVGDLTGRNAVVVGRSILVGKPVANLLLAENCTVTIAHSRTRDLPALCRSADILVAAIGRPRMIKGDWIKPGATVIDVGINRIEEAGSTRLVGDVDFETARAVAGAITPVPGGVGPMTIACLLANTVTAAKLQLGIA